MVDAGFACADGISKLKIATGPCDAAFNGFAGSAVLQGAAADGQPALRLVLG